MARRQDSDREVLTSLPRTRPVRRSAKRNERPAAKARASAPPRSTPPAKPRATKRTAAGAAKAPPTRAAKAPPTRAAKAPPARAAKDAAAGAAKAPPARVTKARPKDAGTAAERRPTAPKRKVPPAGYAAPTARPEEPAASGATELISTTIQAAAELAQIGLTVGRQTLQSMLDRLPKP